MRKRRKYLSFSNTWCDIVATMLKPRKVSLTIAIKLHWTSQSLYNWKWRQNTPKKIWRMGVTRLYYEESSFYNPELHTHKILPQTRKKTYNIIWENNTSRSLYWGKIISYTKQGLYARRLLRKLRILYWARRSYSLPESWSILSSPFVSLKAPPLCVVVSTFIPTSWTKTTCTNHLSLLTQALSIHKYSSLPSTKFQPQIIPMTTGKHWPHK